MLLNCRTIPLVFSLLSFLFFFPVFAQNSSVSPFPQINANSLKNSLPIFTSDTLSIKVCIDAGNSLGVDCDWWVVADTPFGWYHYEISQGWLTDFDVTYQGSLTDLSSFEILNISGLPVGTYTFYFGVDLNMNGSIDVDQLYYDSVVVNVISSSASCGSLSTFFIVEPLDPVAYTGIDPLGATNPSAHTFPTAHTYMMLTDKATPSPFYIPGSVTITNVIQVKNITLGSTDYVISFSPCAEVTGYFDHITTLTSDILIRVGEFTDCRVYAAGDYEYEWCDKEVSIAVSAGTLLGYAGGPKAMSGALDFGLRDTRITPLNYVNPERLVNPDQRYVVCPYDYFEAGLVYDNLYAKLQVLRTTVPVCGTVELDVPNTAQGRWYLKGTSGFGEEDHLALVPSNKEPDTIGVFSVGNSSIGTDAYYFDFVSSGQVNRSFSEITSDGNIYCWDNFRNREASLESGSSSPIKGYMFLQMTGNTDLRLERIDQDAFCPTDPNTLAFSSAAVEFER